MKYNWNSIRKTKKKIFLGFTLQDITPWNHKNLRRCYFGGFFWGLGTNVQFNVFLWFCASWCWCRKDQKSLTWTSHKIFSQCLIVNSSLLRAFMVQNNCKDSFSGGKSRKNGILVIKINFSFQKYPLEF